MTDHPEVLRASRDHWRRRAAQFRTALRRIGLGEGVDKLEATQDTVEGLRRIAQDVLDAEPPADDACSYCGKVGCEHQDAARAHMEMLRGEVE